MGIQHKTLKQLLGLDETVSIVLKTRRPYQFAISDNLHSGKHRREFNTNPHTNAGTERGVSMVNYRTLPLFATKGGHIPPEIP